MRFLVYLGSVLLVLGTVLMFYVREKRAWVLFSDGKIRFAMSSGPQRTGFARRISKTRRESATARQGLES